MHDSNATTRNNQAAAIARQIEKLRDEESRIRARSKRRRLAADRDQNRLFAIDDQIVRLQLSLLVGVPGGVKLAYRVSPSDRCFHLNDSRGTIVKINRTRATVRFDVDEREWSVRLKGLLPVDRTQGCTADALAAGVGFEEGRAE